MKVARTESPQIGTLYQLFHCKKGVHISYILGKVRLEGKGMNETEDGLTNSYSIQNKVEKLKREHLSSRATELGACLLCFIPLRLS